MKGILNPRIKICCISSKKEALNAIAFGASALGFVGNMPSGPGIISDHSIHEIVQIIPPPISTFLLTAETDSYRIIAQHQRVKTQVIQLVDKLKYGSYQHIRKELPGIKLVQVIHVIDERSIEDAIDVSGNVDTILLDSGNPNLEIKELGGTGRIHNWDLSKQIRKQIDIPIFLAGGINKDNVREAIEKVKPFGIDLCSGVRTHQKLDLNKLAAFFKALNA